MSQGWTTIFMGPPIEAEVLRSKLQTRGIPSLIPEDALRTIDPYMVGGALVFDRALQVPDSAVAAARECMADVDEETAMREGERELPPGFFDEEPQADAELSKRILQLSRRIRWCAIIPFGAPFVLWQLGEYLRSVELLGRKPPLHRMTIAAAWLSPLYFLSYFLPPILFGLQPD